MRRLLLTLALIPTVAEYNADLLGSHIVFYDPVIEVPINTAEAKCLATMVYGEARGESEQGMVAVAYTAVNRAVNKTVCGVVLAPKQYSIFNNNPTLRAAAMSPNIEPKQKNIIDKAGWEQAVKIAQSVMRKEVPDLTNGATHYLAPTVMKLKKYKYPKWSKQYQLMAVIDNHKFYKQKDKS